VQPSATVLLPARNLAAILSEFMLSAKRFFDASDPSQAMILIKVGLFSG
jgi:hypothetical protein